MAKIIGIIVVFASVLGGYILSHGKLAALIQPFEVMIIGGAALLDGAGEIIARISQDAHEAIRIMVGDAA